MTTVVTNTVGRRLRPRYRRLRRVLSSGQPHAAAPSPSPSNLSPLTRMSPTPVSGTRLAQSSAMPGQE